MPSSSNAAVNHSLSDENVLLATAVVKVKFSSGDYVLARFLFWFNGCGLTFIVNFRHPNPTR